MADTMTETKMTEYVNDFSLDMAHLTGMVIKDNAQYTEAVETIKVIKQRRDVITEFYKPMKDAAYKAHKEICAKEKEMLKPFDDAEKTIRKALDDYTTEQERIRKEEEAKVKAETEAEREKLLAQIAELEAQGDFAGAESLKATLDAVDDMVSTAVTVEGNTPTANGAYAVKDYEIIGMDLSKVPCEILGMVIRPVDEALVKKLIKESKGTIQIPGITYKETSSVRIRK